MVARRAVLCATVLSLTLLVGKQAVAQTPGLVVDASSGRVLFAERATDPWYPASITKLMTVYVALDQVRQRRASMNTLLTMSEYAASQPPSKLGLKPGQTMTLENAIKVIMTKSANDMATMIGENLGGGSVEGFASLMNDASRRIGMHESRWYNPSGLPDARQQTSARDMALLARALIADFPEHQNLFSIGAVKFGQSIMRNHNGLLGRYPGADGMKTGFICSGGFNVVATATQGGRRLIAVVMGYPSAKERDLRTADLFDSGFSSAGWGAQHIEALPPSASMSPPDMRASVCGPKRRQPQEDDETSVVQASAAATGNADNLLSNLFAPPSFASAGPGTAILGSRRTLGPRVAFEPIPVWLGATPGETQDAIPVTGPSRIRIAGKKVKPVRVSRVPVGPAALAFTSTGAAPPAVMSGNVETAKTSRRPTSQAALRDNLDKKPAAETRPKLGAIVPKVKAAAVDGTNPGAGKPAAIAKKARPKAAQAAKPKAPAESE